MESLPYLLIYLCVALVIGAVLAAIVLPLVRRFTAGKFKRVLLTGVIVGILLQLFVSTFGFNMWISGNYEGREVTLMDRLSYGNAYVFALSAVTMLVAALIEVITAKRS